MSAAFATLILLRHGESEWNRSDRFAGWVDIRVTPQGVDQARNAGRLLREHDLRPDCVHTSVLRRAVHTADIALDVADRGWIPVVRSWRLNERHYGALQGKNRQDVITEFGYAQFMLWRRSFRVAPPFATPQQMRVLADDVRYAALPRAALPRGESLSDIETRLLPYWYDLLAPELTAGRTVLVVAHGNSLRVLIKHLESVSEEDIASVEVPIGRLLVYKLDRYVRPAARGTYLE